MRKQGVDVNARSVLQNVHMASACTIDSAESTFELRQLVWGHCSVIEYDVLHTGQICLLSQSTKSGQQDMASFDEALHQLLTLCILEAPGDYMRIFPKGRYGLAQVGHRIGVCGKDADLSRLFFD